MPILINIFIYIMIKDKLNKINEIIELAKKKTSNINKEDVEKIEEYYKWPDGTVFTKKMICDFSMWKDFENEYGFNKLGIIKLREILGNPADFRKEYGV